MPSPSLVFRPRSCLHILAGKLYYHDFNYPLWINDSKSMSSSFNSVLSCRPVCSTALQTVSLGMLTGTLTQTRLNRLALPALGTFSLFTPVLEGAMLAEGWKTKPTYHQSFSTNRWILSWEPDLGMAPSSASSDLPPAPHLPKIFPAVHLKCNCSVL